jgi:hypothetical protein
MARNERPPYKATAGALPPRFAGRRDNIDGFDYALEGLETGEYANPHAVIGARGLGKTTLLIELDARAVERGWKTWRVEVQRRHRLEDQIAYGLSHVIADLAPGRAALSRFADHVRAATSLKITSTDLPVEISWSLTAEERDPARVGQELSAVMNAVGELARDKGSGCALMVDELHEAPLVQLESVVVALHDLGANREAVPFHFVGAGLPLLPAMIVEANTYGERMFELWDLEPLTFQEMVEALREPAKDRGRDFDEDALEAIFGETQGCPYMVQRWGIDVWRLAPGSTINSNDVAAAKPYVIEHFDRNFYRLRTERITDRERAYVVAMANLEPSARTSSAVARALGKSTSQLSVVRESLIRKGVIAAPAHGQVEFTVPGYDEYLLRVDRRPGRHIGR